MTDKRIRRLGSALSIPLAVGLVASAWALPRRPPGVPDDDRLNNGIVVDVDTIESQALHHQAAEEPAVAGRRAAPHRRRAQQPKSRRRHRVGRVVGAGPGPRRGLRGTVAETVAINDRWPSMTLT